MNEKKKHYCHFFENFSPETEKAPLTPPPASIYLFKINIGNKRRHWRSSGVFLVNFEQISHLLLVVFPLLALKKQMQGGSAILNFIHDALLFL